MPLPAFTASYGIFAGRVGKIGRMNSLRSFYAGGTVTAMRGAGAMKYAVFFEDNEAHADKRNEFMEDHLRFLETHTARINAAGPLRDAETGAPSGGLWLVEAGAAAEVMDLVRADPFWPTGLRKSIRVLEWTQVFGGGRRLIPR